MATRTITETDCDRCNKSNVPVKTIHVETGRDLDPAGGHSEPAGFKFDLCADCAIGLLSKLVDSWPDYKTREAWIDGLKLKRKERW